MSTSGARPLQSPIPSDQPNRLHVEFCGTVTEVAAPGPFVMGREGDLMIDDNRFLHRTFLTLTHDRFWWLTNIGSRLTATVGASGAMQSWMAPGATLPVLFTNTEVRFTAGPTNYCLTLLLDEPAMSVTGTVTDRSGHTTAQPIRLTERQSAVVIALAEHSLLNGASNPSDIPSSADAARRLGWKLTTFNRQLDAVCQKLAKSGVRGLHGDQGSLASSRRARLVEYALSTRLVTPDDLAVLDGQPSTDP